MKRRVSPVLALLAALALCPALPARAQPFRAGAATSNITPPLGVSINGGTQDRVATHIHDELHARCLVLDDGATKLAIVVNDSCMIPREVFDEAKRLAGEATGIPAANMLLSATHTHSAPASASVFQSNADMAYREFLARRIADGICRAHNNLAPARVGWGVGSSTEHVNNRRWFLKEGAMPLNPFGARDRVKMNPTPGADSLVEPAGPIDPTVSVLALQTPDGRPVALLANYSLHYVGGTGGGHISADYFGAFAARVAHLLGAERQDPPFVAMMSNGTSGDINNVNFREKRAAKKPYEQIQHVANSLADEALKVWRSIRFHDHAPLQAAQREITLGVRKPTDDEVTRAKEILARPRNLPRLSTPEEIYARETVQMRDYPDHVDLILQTLRIGDVGIAAIPCEVFVEIGLELRERSPFKPAFTVSLANGYNGYLPTPKHHALGGYETWRAKSSYLETGASPKMMDVLLELFESLK